MARSGSRFRQSGRSALGPGAGLDEFAAGFGEMLATWERLIGEAADRF